MFTGIVEEIGHVKGIRRGAKSITLQIEAGEVLDGTVVGDSIATNGVCLTVTSLDRLEVRGERLEEAGATRGVFSADVMPETMQRTSLGMLKPGSPVNLERALTLNSRLGGHIVSGHIDGVGRVTKKQQDDNALWLWIGCDTCIMRYIIEKGSITIQGVSLTVAKVTATEFAVSLIPHTQGATTLHTLKVGDTVNLENDVIAKYVERLMNDRSAEGRLQGKNVNVRSAEGRLQGKNDDVNKIDMYRNFMKK